MTLLEAYKTRTTQYSQFADVYEQGYDDAKSKLSQIIEDAEEVYPYKVIGRADTYSDYNQGWCDALAFIDSMMHI